MIICEGILFPCNSKSRSKRNPYPATSRLSREEKEKLAKAGVITAVAIALLITLGIAISGPLLWGIAPTTGLMLTGKIITIMSIAAGGILILALPPALCLAIFCKCCSCCFDCI